MRPLSISAELSPSGSVNWLNELCSVAEQTSLVWRRTRLVLFCCVLCECLRFKPEIWRKHWHGGKSTVRLSVTQEILYSMIADELLRTCCCTIYIIMQNDHYNVKASKTKVLTVLKNELIIFPWKKDYCLMVPWFWMSEFAVFVWFRYVVGS